MGITTGPPRKPTRRHEYVLRSGRMITLPRFIWRHLPRARCRVTFS